MAVMRAETVIHGEAGKPLLGMISSACGAFMKDNCTSNVDVEIQAQYCRIPTYSGAHNKHVRTEPCRTSVPGGLAQDTVTPMLLHKFWSLVLERTRDFIEGDAGAANSSGVPSAADLSDGIRDAHLRGINLSAVFPEVVNSGHSVTGSAQPPAKNTVFVVGNSHGSLIAGAMEKYTLWRPWTASSPRQQRREIMLFWTVCAMLFSPTVGGIL